MKIVRFAQETSSSIDCPCHTQLKAEERIDHDELWYSHSEFLEIKRGTRDTAKAFKMALGDESRLDPTEHCIRGIEERVSLREKDRVRRSIRMTVRSVLKEQERQLLNSVNYPELVRESSQRHSVTTTQIALERARTDEAEALRGPRRPLVRRDEQQDEGRSATPTATSSIGTYTLHVLGGAMKRMGRKNTVVARMR